ncbi:MAG: LamG domain-containing protein [Candidatus Micrarchaeota archaeon]|nr:LamG domain-containing protein [Candidatus Micrarchaeota archaeon]MDE1851990.1 LamG domain-containing protein [Candidatus Micrarchaeota archaeon]
MWFSEISPAGREFLWARGADGAAKDYDMIIDSSHQYYFRVFTDSDVQYNVYWQNTGFGYNTWYQVAATWDSTGTFKLYHDGALVKSGSGNSYPSSFYSSLQAIGGNSSWDQVFGGSISNVQVYNLSLDNTSIKTLYLEGIGGAPVDIQHLVGWWPLNGNANDYSGKNNQGTATNVAWNANWQSGYTAPTT